MKLFVHSGWIKGQCVALGFHMFPISWKRLPRYFHRMNLEFNMHQDGNSWNLIKTHSNVIGTIQPWNTLLYCTVFSFVQILYNYIVTLQCKMLQSINTTSKYLGVKAIEDYLQHPQSPQHCMLPLGLIKLDPKLLRRIANPTLVITASQQFFMGESESTGMQGRLTYMYRLDGQVCDKFDGHLLTTLQAYLQRLQVFVMSYLLLKPAVI